jgi:hypothetical protein
VHQSQLLLLPTWSHLPYWPHLPCLHWLVSVHSPASVSSFCGHLRVSITKHSIHMHKCNPFLTLDVRWKATFFTVAMVIDEKHQKANRRDMICCVKRKTVPDEDDTGAKEGKISTYFRKYHTPHILSKRGRLMTIVSFTALLILVCMGSCAYRSRTLRETSSHKIRTSKITWPLSKLIFQMVALLCLSLLRAGKAYTTIV